MSNLLDEVSETLLMLSKSGYLNGVMNMADTKRTGAFHDITDVSEGDFQKTLDKVTTDTIDTAPKAGKSGDKKLKVFRGDSGLRDSIEGVGGSAQRREASATGQWFTAKRRKAKDFAGFLSDYDSLPFKNIQGMKITFQELLDGYIRSAVLKATKRIEFGSEDLGRLAMQPGLNKYGKPQYQFFTEQSAAQDAPKIAKNQLEVFQAKLQNIKTEVGNLIDDVEKGKKTPKEVAFILSEGIFPFANDRAKLNFIETMRVNPRLALTTVAKGIFKMGVNGLIEGALFAPAVATLMPVPANRDEQVLLDSFDNRGRNEFITAYNENNMNKEFVQRIVNFEDAPPPIEKDGQLQTHLMSAEFLGKDNTIPAVFPRIINDDGVLKELSLEEAKQFAIENGEFIQFPNIDDAIRYSQQYKGTDDSEFNQFYTTEGLFAKHFGKSSEGVPVNYMKNYMAAIHNEFDGTYRSNNTYTNDTVSPEAQMTIKAKLDEYYMAYDGDEEFFGMAEPSVDNEEFFGMAEPIDSRKLVAPPSDMGSVNLGYVMDAPDYSDLHSMQAIRTENGYKITDALNMEQTPENTRLINDLNMQNPNIPEGSFNRNFIDDSYVIDIDIPNFIQAEPFTLDAEPFNNEGRPMFDTSAVSIDRQTHMQKMIDAFKTYRYNE